MTTRRLAHAIAALGVLFTLDACTTDSGAPLSPVGSRPANDLPHPEPDSWITQLNPGQWPPQIRVTATSWADFGWQTANVRSNMYWGVVESCYDTPPQRRFGQQSDGSYAQGTPPQTVVVDAPTSEVNGAKVRVIVQTLHVFFEGGAYSSYAEQYNTADTLCLDRPPEFDPPPLNASISGPSSIQSAGYCTWTASVSGGASPFTFAWKRDGQSVSSSQSYTASVAGGTFWIQLTVSDAAGQSVDRWLNVTEDSGGEACLW